MNEAEGLEQIKEVMKGSDWSIQAVMTFTHGMGVQVYSLRSGRRKKVGPILFPYEGDTVFDVLTTLASMTQNT